MDVSVIIVNYNTCKMTSECIDSIFKKTSGIQFEVIVVDNGSTDGSKEFFEKDSRIKYIYSDENLGFGRANNVGSRFAKGKFIFCLNPDTILINNAIYILFKYISENSQCSACGANLIGPDMNPVHSFCRLMPGIAWETNLMLYRVIEKILFGKNWTYNYTSKNLTVKYITGAALMMRNNGIIFDPDFFMYYEDTELCYRLGAYGNLVNVPSAKIKHLEGASTCNSDNNINIRKLMLEEEGRALYYEKTTHPAIIKICNSIYSLSLSIKSFIFRGKYKGAFYNKRKEIYLQYKR